MAQQANTGQIAAFDAVLRAIKKSRTVRRAVAKIFPGFLTAGVKVGLKKSLSAAQKQQIIQSLAADGVDIAQVGRFVANLPGTGSVETPETKALAEIVNLLKDPILRQALLGQENNLSQDAFNNMLKGVATLDQKKKVVSQQLLVGLNPVKILAGLRRQQQLDAALAPPPPPPKPEIASQALPETPPLGASTGVQLAPGAPVAPGQLPAPPTAVVAPVQPAPVTQTAPAQLAPTVVVPSLTAPIPSLLPQTPQNQSTEAATQQGPGNLTSIPVPLAVPPTQSTEASPQRGQGNLTPITQPLAVPTVSNEAAPQRGFIPAAPAAPAPAAPEPTANLTPAGVGEANRRIALNQAIVASTQALKLLPPERQNEINNQIQALRRAGGNDDQVLAVLNIALGKGSPPSPTDQGAAVSPIRQAPPPPPPPKPNRPAGSKAEAAAKKATAAAKAATRRAEDINTRSTILQALGSISNLLSEPTFSPPRGVSLPGSRPTNIQDINVLLGLLGRGTAPAAAGLSPLGSLISGRAKPFTVKL